MLKKILLALLPVLLFVSQADEVFAQRKRVNKHKESKFEAVKKHPKETKKRKRVKKHKDNKFAAVKKLPKGHKKMYVEGKKYYCHHGRFYKKYGRTYFRVTAPYGARLRYLPRERHVVYIKGMKYYRYHGVYYRYDPYHRVYVVVKPPVRISLGFHIPHRIVIHL